ncbi:type II toxin-antitoxin system RelE/ParE family toxin [bacterium]|nr:MAG: type II toxin-antitoxin system RelE/ParE family toxin [bacterium]
MKRLPVVYLPSAQADLLDGAAYIRRDSPAAAADWLALVDSALSRLSAFPESGTRPKDERLAAKGYRLVVLGEHLAFYVVTPRCVQIRRVLHGKRRYEFLL